RRHRDLHAFPTRRSSDLPDRDRESRDRKLLQLIEKCPRQVVFFIDDAHKLPPPTLTGLKTLVEKKLCVVLIGHPRLGFTLARGIDRKSTRLNSSHRTISY